MAKQIFSNNADSSLLVTIDNLTTVIPMQIGHGAKFSLSSAQTGDFEMITITDGTNIEIVRATNLIGDDLTVVRGQEGTTAQSFIVGSLVMANTTKESFELIQTDILANSTDISTNTAAIAANVTGISSNATNIAENLDSINKNKLSIQPGRFVNETGPGTSIWDMSVHNTMNLLMSSFLGNFFYTLTLSLANALLDTSQTTAAIPQNSALHNNLFVAFGSPGVTLTIDTDNGIKNASENSINGGFSLHYSNHVDNVFSVDQPISINAANKIYLIEITANRMINQSSAKLGIINVNVLSAYPVQVA